jgi:sugar phosphate isomerase/epimerase
MIELGMHTDNWRTLSGNFKAAVDSAVKYGLSHIEFGVIHGQYFVNGLGYDPAVSLQSNPRALRRYLDQKGLRVSQIDGAFPLMGPDGSTFGVQYIQQSIRFAAEVGCPIVDTTDGAFRTEGYSDDGVFRITCENYKQCLAWAEDYNVILNIETHGPYTTNGDFLERLFTHFESEHLRFNFDTGNTFISGQDPLEYLKRFRKYLSHAHIKDVSPGLAAAVRGEETGIACSEVPIGGGVNAENIKKCIGFLRETQWNGVLSIECYGADENIRQSVQFLRDALGS